MQLTLRLLIAPVALLAAGGILLVSLTSSVMQVHSSTGLLNKSMYFDDQFLPDHITYPALMAIDRFRLESASPVERVYLQTEYANRRLTYALALFERGQADLAVSTLTKAQKYLLYAGLAVLDEHHSERLTTHVQKTIDYHIRKIELAMAEQALSDSQRAAVDKLNEELRVMNGQLQTQFE